MPSHHIRWYPLISEQNECNDKEVHRCEDHARGTACVKQTQQRGGQYEPGRYEIRLKGHLDDKWAEWFDGLTITRQDNGETRLRGLVVDQAALHGVLRKVRDLGLPLVA